VAAAGPDRPCTVGLTGGLASGKSTVAAMLEARGAAVLDADAVVRELYRPGAEGAETVRELFGPALLAADGAVDREALGRVVLGDDAALERLNGAIHPLVRRRVERWIDGLASSPATPPVAVVEAALLVETGGYRSYDLLVVVRCDPSEQVERAVARGMDRDRALALLAVQASVSSACALADVVVDNSGSRDDLRRAVDEGWRRILRACRERRGRPGHSSGGSSHSVA
jgi:dephospho-CoA kinase